MGEAPGEEIRPTSDLKSVRSRTFERLRKATRSGLPLRVRRLLRMDWRRHSLWALESWMATGGRCHKTRIRRRPAGGARRVDRARSWTRNPLSGRDAAPSKDQADESGDDKR